ncbi:putative flavin-dependent halogenase/O-methyltransferase bifunctional protein [Chaetomium sp. MPI-SDFR-AT-0129]|nr:putative flavin-dependent halogenase/O-methyltransferase bifunctional protein [Chaetomium sp. MPI-SDFR-AT-0129]
MSIPKSCTVLVAGGGPGGSFAAAALAREGIDVVILESDKHPRYHIGESMLPSMRHFLRFIDCDDKFNAHGFVKKNGAAFRLNRTQPEAYTDFIAAGGPNGHAWNVVRSEADELLFNHAAACGAQIFDTTKVETVEFENAPDNTTNNSASNTEEGITNPGKPVRATWKRKDGTTGTISFDYIVDATGRFGLLSTKYLKNRKFNQNLKNIANWGYWKGGGTYGVGTHKAGSPFFAALKDASGWCWFIPLHDGTHSVGLVQNQQMATDKKRQLGSPGTKEFYLHSLDQVPEIQELLVGGELVSDIKSASDWSYSASSYAFPYARIVGDAGCFIDPYFSSGVHLAVLGGVSAAVTIAASIRGDCDESAAASWHSKKTTESYTRFYLVVSSALKQIRAQEDPVIQDIDEEGFQRAFDLFRPVIQGTADADPTGKLAQSDISNTVNFCLKAFSAVTPEQKETVINKLQSAGLGDQTHDDESIIKALNGLEKSLTPQEALVLDILRSRRMIREDGFNMDSFALDAIDGLTPRLERGNLGLAKAETAKLDRAQLYSADFLEGRRSGVRTETSATNSAAAGMKGSNGLNGATNGTANGVGNGHVNGDDEHATPAATQSTTSDTPKPALGNLFASPVGGHAALLDDVGRHAVMNTLYEAAENLETPFDFVMRLGNATRLLTFIRVGLQLNVFNTLADTPDALSAEQLAAPTGAHPEFVDRVVRYLAANRLVSEVGPGRFAARKLTRFLADPGVAGGAAFFQAAIAQVTHHLPNSHLARDNYAHTSNADISSSPSVFQDWSGSDLYPWLKARPDLLSSFQGLMTVDRGGDWLDCVSFGESDLNGQITGKPVLVDVGGNVGHQTQRILARNPHLAGRLVVQDLPETVANAPPTKGITFQAHDFFKPQPVHGARYYYLRSILHNWDDESSVDILRGLVPALGPDSLVLIDELVVPDTGADAWVTGQDLNMMLVFKGAERTKGQWNTLLGRAGLEMVDIKTYAPVRRSSIIFDSTM